MKKLLIGLIILFLAMPLWATIYYVDKTTGNDGDDGESEGNAWETIAKVMSTLNGDQSDDIVKFKCGEVWREQYSVAGYGTSGHQFIHTQYGEGDQPKIMASDSHLTGWADNGGDVWYKSITNQPEGVWLDDLSYPRASGAGTVNAANRWYWTGGTLYIYATADPDGFYSTIEVPIRSYAVAVGSKNYVKFDDIHFDNARVYVMYASGSSTNTEFVNCTGTRGGKGVACANDSATGFLLDTCDLNCSNRGRYNNTIIANIATVGPGTIKNCTIRNGTHAGMLLKHTSSWLVENNEFYSDGGAGGNNYYGRNLDIQGLEGQGYYVIRYNYFHNAGFGNGIVAGPDQFTGESHEIYYNIFAHGTYGGIGTWATDGRIVKNCKFYNNVVYGSLGPGFIIGGSGTPQSGNLIKNNIFMENDIDAMYPGNPNQEIRFHNDLRDKYFFDNNCIYNSNTPGTIWDTNALRTVAYMDTNRAEWTNNIASDPIFINAGGSMELDTDYLIPIGSPCKDTGTNVGLTTDYWNNLVPSGAAQDMGTHEYQQGDIPVLRIRDILRIRNVLRIK